MVNFLIKPASGMCNMQCDYCFYCDEVEKRSRGNLDLMSDDTLRNVVRKALFSAKQSCTIAFQGGEPTLSGLDFYKKLILHINHYNKKNIQINYAIQTNGYNMTEEWCEFFKENNFLVGLSVDGTEVTHDKYRHNHNGEGTYKKVIEASRLFDKFNVEYNILTVVNSETATNIVEIYREYQTSGWKHLQFITCLDPLGEERGTKGYSLTPPVYGTFLIHLFDLWYRDWKKGRQPYIRQFENYIGILMGYQPESCEQRGICGIQNVVESDGSVYPCDFYALDQYCLGNINNNTMSEIQKKREEIEFCHRSKNHSDFCVNCKWFPLCRGGCYRSLEGEIDNYFCEGYQMFFNHCYSRMQEIAEFIK